MYNAVVIGAGSIGALKDDAYDSLKGKNILTHAHAYCVYPRTELVGIVDIDIAKAVKAGNKWNTPIGVDISKITDTVDIISICTPDSLHLPIAKQIAKTREDVKLVIVEKPVGVNSVETEEIINVFKDRGIILLVNYTRRYEITLQILSEDIRSGLLGRVHSCVIYYDRGIVRDGCHALDVCNLLFGNCISVYVPPFGHSIIDYSIADPSITVFLSYERCGSVILLPSDGREFSIFDIVITTSEGQFHYSDHGNKLAFRQKIDEPVYGNYKALQTEEVIRETELKRSLYYLVENAVGCLEKVTNPICTGEDALKVQVLLDEIIHHGITGRRV